MVSGQFMKRRLGDISFICLICLLMVSSYYVYGLRGFVIVLWALFLPLYILRIFVWSSWSWLQRWLSSVFTPSSYVILVFFSWGILSILVWILVANMVVIVGPSKILPTWVRLLGSVLAGGGLTLSLWAQWLIGFKTAILITRIFDKETKEGQKVVKTGPYALFPHPIFLGEWLVIFGCFFLTSQVSLLVLLSIAFLSDIFAAKGEERDLQARFGEEYRAYRSQFWFSGYKRDE
jgi:protein-S-isoprenylcysteine O-methyltransferase Ste14